MYHYGTNVEEISNKDIKEIHNALATRVDSLEDITERCSNLFEAVAHRIKYISATDKTEVRKYINSILKLI